MIEGEGVRIRRAEWEDVDFLVDLLAHDEVEPFLAVARTGPDTVSVRVCP